MGILLMLGALVFGVEHARLERVADERLEAWVDYELSVLDSGIVPWESWDEGLEPAPVYPSRRVQEHIERLPLLEREPMPDAWP